MFRYTTTTRFAIAVASMTITPLFMVGCVSVAEESLEAADQRPDDVDHLQDDNPFPLDRPRGLPISRDEVPEPWRARIPEGAAVERYGDQDYLVVRADGTVILMGPKVAAMQEQLKSGSE